MKTHVGVLGLGTMGAPMAQNLLAAGHPVTVHNRTRHREEPLADLGAQRAETPATLAAAVDVLLVCVSDTPDLKAVLTDRDDAAIHGLKSGALVIDCSTVAPAAARSFAQLFADRGIGFIDAPVSGGSEGAIKGTLAVMCGGNESDYERALPILNVIGGSISRVGDSGAGQTAKAVNQVLISGTYQALAEGLILAEKLGVDPKAVVNAIQGGAAASWVLNNRADNMINNDYPLGFRMRLHRKDLGIAIEAAEQAGAPVDLARYVAQCEDELIADGSADEDMSALCRKTRREAGL